MYGVGMGKEEPVLCGTRRVGVLLFFLVIGTVVANQIFNMSGEHTRAFARSLKRYSIPHFRQTPLGAAFIGGHVWDGGSNPHRQQRAHACLHDFIFWVAPICAHLELQLHHQLSRTPCRSSRVTAVPAGTTTCSSDTGI
jgi:hypothetical protein